VVNQQYDYIIIGSGIAGLFAALAAQEHGSVLLLTKGRIDDSNTRYAQGGIAAAVGSGDSPELHLEDTLKAGAGLCDEYAARVLTFEGPQRIAELIGMGVAFDQLHGETALAKEGAHSQARILHAGGDATGAHIELTLADLARSSRVQIMEHVLATRIVVDDRSGEATGVEALDVQSGSQSSYEGSHIILATGGAGQLFQLTSNPQVATGDGVALAFWAGAHLMDMEFYQFHPTVLLVPGVPHFLISEAVRGEGGILRNLEGQAFMKEYHPLADLAPRDVVSRAIVTEMRRAGSDHVLLDVTHLAASRILARFPTIHQTCLQHGVDITRELIPVAPAAHYMMGGVKTNLWGETTIPRLYACGEVSCTGVHGANRLASNSLLETIVFSRRIIERTLGAGSSEYPPGGPEWAVRMARREPSRMNGPHLDIRVLQELMWRDVGIVREGQQLRDAADVLGAWSQEAPRAGDRAAHELSAMTLVGWLIAEAAILRRESRGAHYRSDYAEPSPRWAHHLTIVGAD
jgi:L-aspartate oxidase